MRYPKTVDYRRILYWEKVHFKHFDCYSRLKYSKTRVSKKIK